MKYRKPLMTVLTLFIFILSSCSSANKILSNTFHNITYEYPARWKTPKIEEDMCIYNIELDSTVIIACKEIPNISDTFFENDNIFNAMKEAQAQIFNRYKEYSNEIVEFSNSLKGRRLFYSGLDGDAFISCISYYIPIHNEMYTVATFVEGSMMFEYDDDLKALIESIQYSSPE